MLIAEAIANVRVGIRESGKKHYSDTDIQSCIEAGIMAFGLRIKAKTPAFFNARLAVASTTHVFAWPSDCVEVLKVWDLGTTAGTITGATNASPIVITEASHGRADGAIVNVQAVGGNTAANGTWAITYIDANSYSLDGSTGNAAYTSGGLAWTEPDAPDEIRLKLLADADASSDYVYYNRGKYIVVDDYSFTNDIVVDYSARPDEISDIPEEYHHGLVSWGVVNLMRYEKNDPYVADKQALVQLHSNVLQQVMRDIDTYMKTSTEPKKVRDVWGQPGNWRRF